MIKKAIAILCLLPLVAFGNRVVNKGAAPAGGGDGPDAWYYAGSGKDDTDFSTNIDDGWGFGSFAYGDSISVGSAGTCTLISFEGFSAINPTQIDFKIALFDSSGNLLAQGTTSSTSGTPEWLDVAVNQAVTATTYYVFVVASSNSGRIMRDTDDSSYYESTAYASFPPDPASPVAESGSVFAVRMYVD